MIDDNLFSVVEAEGVFMIMSLLKLTESSEIARMMYSRSLPPTPSVWEVLGGYKAKIIKERYLELAKMKDENLVSSEEYDSLSQQVAEDIYIALVLDFISKSESGFDFSVCKSKNSEEGERKYFWPNPENYKVDDECLKKVMEEMKKEFKFDENGEVEPLITLIKSELSQTIQKIEKLMSQKEHFIKLINNKI